MSDLLPVPVESTPGGAVLLYESANGAVHASLRFAGLRANGARFALGAINGTREPLLVTFYAHARGGAEVPIAPYSLWVDAQTHAQMEIPIPWLALLGARALSARLQGRNVHQRVEAAMPRLRSPLWFFAGAAAVALGVAVLAALQPRVRAFDVPARAVAGATVTIRYATSGTGRRIWELDDLAGTRIAGGTLADAGGNLVVNAPASDRVRAYVLRLRERGAFGEAIAARPFVVETPAPPIAPPRITAFALDASRVPDGGTVVARYRIDAQSGDVLASDAQGTIWAEAPTNPRGITRLTLPRFGRAKELQIRLVVRRGRQLAASGIGLEVTP